MVKAMALSLIPHRTEQIHVGSSNSKTIYHVGNNMLESISEIVDLGFHLESDLIFDFISFKAFTEYSFFV